jgi:hypothetical protein
VLFRSMCLNETYSKVRVGKHLSDSFPIQNGLKQGDALSPLLFNFAFRISHSEGPGKPGGTEIEWDTSASGLCRLCESVGRYIDTMRISHVMLSCAAFLQRCQRFVCYFI